MSAGNDLFPPIQIRRCLNTACPQGRHPYRPEEEGRLALPKHEFGLDVIAFVGQQRYKEELKRALEIMGADQPETAEAAG